MPPGLLRVVVRYHQCKTFGIAPRAGGLDDQSRLEMLVFQIIASTTAKVEAEGMASLAKSSGPLGAVLMMSAMGRSRV